MKVTNIVDGPRHLRVDGKRIDIPKGQSKDIPGLEGDDLNIARVSGWFTFEDAPVKGDAKPPVKVETKA